MRGRKIFRVDFVDDTYHRVATCGGMDSEFSHKTRDPKVSHVIAPSLEIAQFVFKSTGRLHDSMTEVRWTELGGVDLDINVGPW